MSRDYRKLRAFHSADQLVVALYRATKTLPMEERFGLQAQLRRSAVSVPCNIVEGSARTSTTDYCRFLTIAHGSAAECHYLLGLAVRLEFLSAKTVAPLVEGYHRLQGSLGALVNSLTPEGARGPEL